MEHVHPANHGWLIHEWKCINCPRNATNLGIDLDQDLVHDRPQIFALRNGVAQDNLRRNWELLKQESLDVIVEGVLAFGTGDEQYDCLHVGVEFGLEFLSPVICLHGVLDLEDFGLSFLVAKLLKNLVHG